MFKFFDLFAKKEDSTTLENAPDLTVATSAYRTQFDIPDADIYEAFDEMNIFDDRCGTNVKKRKQILLSKGYTIEPNDLAGQPGVVHSEWLKENFINKQLNQTLDLLLNSIAYGFQVIQIKYKYDDNGNGVIDWVKPIPQSLWEIDENNRPYYIGTGSAVNAQTILEKHPQNFIWHTHENSPEGDPRGIGAFHRAYWFWKFKKQDLVLWQKFLERFGVPLLIGKFQQIGNTEKMKEYAEAVVSYLKKIRYDGVAAMSGSDVETLEARGNGEAFDKLINICNQAIDICTLGTTMLTNPGGGSFNLAEVHQEILDQQTQSDGEALSETINETLIPWLIDAKFGTQQFYPTFHFNFGKQATTDEIFKAVALGIPVDSDDMYTMTGLPKPKTEETAFIKTTESTPPVDNNSLKKKDEILVFAAKENKAKEELSELDMYTFPAEQSSITAMEEELGAWLNTEQNKYNPTEKFIKSLEPDIFAAFFASVLMGRIHVNNDLTGTPTDIDFNKATSIKYLKDVSTITDTTYSKLFQKNYKYAAEVSRLTAYDFKNNIESSLARAREMGLSKSEWVNTLGKTDILQSVGANKDNPWYWENVYRTNNQTAYNAGVWDRVHETPSSFFGFEYIAIDDRRTTDICSSLNGTLKPVDDDFWSSYTPPNHFQCRSILARIVQVIAETQGIQYTPVPKNIPPFPTKSFAGNSAKKWTKLKSSQRQRINAYGIGDDIIKRNNQIDKNLGKIMTRTK